MRTLTTVLFDLDGTLIDTTELILYCFNHSWQKVCGRSHSPEAFIATMGTPLAVAMRTLLALTDDLNLTSIGEEQTAELVEQLVGEYRTCNAVNHDRLARSFNGVIDAVTELRRRQFLTGIVTSKSRLFAVRGLKLCGLSDLMDTAVFLEDTVLHKPNPEPLCLALERLRVFPQEAVYVGDSRHDIRAGRAAGMRTAAALWGPVRKGELQREGPNFLIPAPLELLKIFP
jgi:pyrophosphatase PpaX